MYKTFQLASIECAFKQTWGEKGFVSDVYQKQYNYLEHQCEKKNPHKCLFQSLYFKIKCLAM